MSATRIDPAAERQNEELAFVKMLDGLDQQVRKQIGTYNSYWEELRQMQDNADKQSHTKGFDNMLNQAEGRLAEAEGALNALMSDFNTAAEDALHCVYVLASRRKNPAIFYGKNSNSLALAKALGQRYTQEERASRRYDEQEALNGIDQVAISSGDTVKEVNRLLDHTSTKRMAEEMDIVTYQSNAKRLFDRIQAEFNKAQNSFEEDQGEVRKLRDAIQGFESRTKEWAADLPREIGATGSPKSMLESTDGYLAATDALKAADTFLRRYENFLDYAKGYAGNVGREFYTEASEEAFKDATRLHAQRIEQQGLFSSYWAMGMALASALIVAVVLVYLDNNLALKNWIMPVAGAAAAIGYFASFMLGRQARDGIMGDLRRALFESVSETVADPPLANRPAQSPQNANSSSDIGSRSDDYFKFRKLIWEKFDNAVAPVAPSVPVTELSTSLAKNLQGVSSRKWPVYEKRMRRRNLEVLAAIAAVTLGLSLLSGGLDPRKSLVFVSRTDDLGPCVLDHGRVLIATGGSYFVSPQDSGSVTEIAKSQVLRIAPSEAASEANPTAKPNLPNCDKPRPDWKTPNQAALVTATDTLAGNVKNGLDSVANMIGARTGQADPESMAGLVTATEELAGSVKSVADRITTSPGNPDSGTSPIVVPVIINAPPVPLAAPESQLIGPTFLTQIYTGSGKVHEFDKGLILLPIFLDPVAGNGDERLGGENRVIDTIQEAFFFGATSLSDQLQFGAAAKLKLLHEIASGYAACMAKARDAFASAGRTDAEPKLRLLVEGFASEKWDAIRDGKLTKDLNLYLAEGRRYAVIQALGISDPWIEISRKPKQLALESWASVDAEAVKIGFQFKDYGAMEAALVRKIPGGSAQRDVPVDMLGRSVVISVDGELPEHCRPKPG